MTYRRVRVLIDGLPPESMVKTAIRDTMTADDFANAPEPDGWGPWSKTDELLAILADRMAWLVYAVYASQGGKPTEPEPMHRPGVGPAAGETREQRRQQALTEAVRAYTRAHDGAYPPPGWDHGVPDIADFD